MTKKWVLKSWELQYHIYFIIKDIGANREGSYFFKFPQPVVVLESLSLQTKIELAIFFIWVGSSTASVQRKSSFESVYVLMGA